jgi:hypothetical protein
MLPEQAITPFPPPRLAGRPRAAVGMWRIPRSTCQFCQCSWVLIMRIMTRHESTPEWLAWTLE